MCLVWAARVTIQAADLCRRHGGIMRIGRAIIIPAIVALGAAGSILASSAASVATTQASAVHAQSVVVSSQPTLHYHD
jgi:hypothetical protein